MKTTFLKLGQMSKKDLAKLIRQWREEMKKQLGSMPKHKREKMEKQEEVDIPEFMKSREQRILKHFKGRQD